MSVKPLRFVAVHLGAGSGENTKSVEFAKKICQDVMSQDDDIQPTICKQCDISSTSTITAKTAVVQLVKMMEDNPDLNCGLGSNLNIDGKVECEAAVMCNKEWSGVGALSGCRNPILLANSLHAHRSVKRPLDLVQPNFLVCSGAKQWMQRHCPELAVPASQLIGSAALSRYQKHKSRYDTAVASVVSPAKKQRTEPQEEEEGETTLDTVGAIAIDYDWNFAAAISSGGISLKYRGRLGQSAAPGGGCWVGENAVAVTTGVGEYITKKLIAKSVCDDIHFQRQDVEDCDEEFDEDEDSWPEKTDDFRFCVSRHIPKKLWSKETDSASTKVGILAVNTYWSEECFHVGDGNARLYLHYGHNTSNMCIGYMTSKDSTGHSFMSNREELERSKSPPKPYTTYTAGSDTIVRTLVLD